MNEEATALCELCENREIPPGGTNRCDRCYELETRIKDDPELAMKVLGGVESRWKVVEGVKALDITFSGDEEPGFTIVVPVV